MTNNFTPPHNFTIVYNGIKNVIDSVCQLGLPFSGNTVPLDYKCIELRAIWDTGATCSVITIKAAKEIGLLPTSKTIIQGVNSREEKNVFAVSLSLPNRVTIPFVKVVECNELAGDYDVLIGMDIIAHGDFAITNSGGQTVFSFRLPSISRIDFTNHENNKNITPHQPPISFKNRISTLTKNQAISKKKKKK